MPEGRLPGVVFSLSTLTSAVQSELVKSSEVLASVVYGSIQWHVKFYIAQSNQSIK